MDEIEKGISNLGSPNKNTSYEACEELRVADGCPNRRSTHWRQPRRTPIRKWLRLPGGPGKPQAPINITGPRKYIKRSRKQHSDENETKISTFSIFDLCADRRGDGCPYQHPRLATIRNGGFPKHHDFDHLFMYSSSWGGCTFRDPCGKDRVCNQAQERGFNWRICVGRRWPAHPNLTGISFDPARCPASARLSPGESPCLHNPL